MPPVTTKLPSWQLSLFLIEESTSQQNHALSNLEYKPHLISKLKCCLSHLAVVFAQSIEARCYVEQWRCSWSSADRRCSNYIWVINNFIAYQGVSYIRGLTVYIWWDILFSSYRWDGWKMFPLWLVTDWCSLSVQNTDEARGKLRPYNSPPRWYTIWLLKSCMK